MNETTETKDRDERLLRGIAAFFVFLISALVAFLVLYLTHKPEAATSNDPTILVQQVIYTVGGGILLGAIGAWSVVHIARPSAKERPVWFCPLWAALLTLSLYVLGYAFLGVWPMGPKTVLMVDMHHQYAPLLSELRHMLFTGEGFLYNFHIGLGASFIPAFAYYLSSPFNLLLVLFPENLLPEGIFFITLLKEAFTAAAFTACVQYLYKNRRAGMVAAGILYAMTGYMLAYSWNIMWLDVVAMLPLTVMAMEHMLKTGKKLPYVLTLAYAIYANYYIGFMLCIFLVLYMAVWQLREPHSLRDRLTACGRFAGGSLLGGGLTAAILIPTAMALGRTSAANDQMKAFAVQFPMFDLAGRFFFDSNPTIRSGNLPNVYCGVLAAILLPIYFCQKHIPLRRRLTYGGLTAVLAVSCTLKQWDLIWHGFHSPNDLPYRFSFLLCFVMLLLAAAVLADLDKVTPKQIGLSIGGLTAYLFLWERFAEKDKGPDPAVLYANVLLLVIYGAVLLVGALKKAPRQAVASLVLLAVCGEMLFGTADTLMALNKNEYFTRHGDYVDNTSTAANKAAVERAQELGRQELGEAFFRLEYLPRNTCVDTARHHYAGITTFASSNPYQTTVFMGNLGYAVNGVNSYLYRGFVPTTDSLLGIQYVILKAKINNHSQLERVEEVKVGNETRYIYRNRLALPVGFMGAAGLRDYKGTKYAPFTSQEDLYAALLGRPVTLFTPMTLEDTSPTASLRGGSSIYAGGGDAAQFKAEITEDGQYFAFVDCGAAESISVRSYEKDAFDAKNTWNVTPHEPNIIDMGGFKAGQHVEVDITTKNGASGNIYIMRLDKAVLEEAIAQLRQGGLQVTAHTSSRIEGKVNAAQAGPMFFSIPYDEGWTATVDGKPVETFPIARPEPKEGEDPEKLRPDGALLGVEIPAGAHDVVISFRPKGFVQGLLISLLCLVLLVLPVIRRRFRKQPAAVPVPDAPAQEPVSLSFAAGEEEPSAGAIFEVHGTAVTEDGYLPDNGAQEPPARETEPAGEADAPGPQPDVPGPSSEDKKD